MAVPVERDFEPLITKNHDCNPCSPRRSVVLLAVTVHNTTNRCTCVAFIPAHTHNTHNTHSTTHTTHTTHTAHTQHTHTHTAHSTHNTHAHRLLTRAPIALTRAH